MQKGHIVEMGPVPAILEAPEHPYAQLLKNSVLFIEDSGHGKVQPPDCSLVQAASEQSGSGMLVEGTRGGRCALRSKSPPRLPGPSATHSRYDREGPCP